MTRTVGRILGIAAIAVVASAHIGTFDTFFAGVAGPYHVQVTIRVPGVVPGLAGITVRVKEPGVTGVSAQAALWNLGVRGAPSPDAAVPVPGAPGVFASDLWIMTSGSYAVNVAVDGAAGRGTVVVPVSVAPTRRLAMQPRIGTILGIVGVFLVVGMLTIIGASSREAVLSPGESPDGRQRAGARRAIAVGAVVVAAALFGGWTWWNNVDAAYGRRLFRPLGATVTTRTAGAGGRVLRIAITDSSYRRQWTPLVPDHGKMMHLFLVGEPAQGAFAHLHPVLVDSGTFDVSLGAVPGGRYRYYADVVHESGFAQTMSGVAEVPAPAASERPLDRDDAYFAGAPGAADTALLGDGTRLVWHRPASLVAREDQELRFTVLGADGATASLESYLGMPAHAIVARSDGNVFVHLHALGSVATISQDVLLAVQRGDTLPSAGRGALPRPALASAAMAGHARAPATWPGELSFPFAFPSAGRYRLWVQARRAGVVQTGVFDATVVEPRAK